MSLFEGIPIPKDPELRRIVDSIERSVSTAFDRIIYRKRRQATVAAATYSMDGRDEVINVAYTATGAVTITPVSAALFQGRSVVVRDSGGNATANNITITGIYTIAADDECVTLASDGTSWYVESKN